MRIISRSFLFLICIYCAVGISAQTIQCTIQGTVFTPDTKNLYLFKATDDFRFADFEKIPVVNGNFAYEIHAEVQEAYVLILEDQWLDGAFVPAVFFNEAGQIHFDLYDSPDDYGRNVINGGPLNQEWEAYNQAQNKRFQPKFDAIDVEADKIPEEEYFSEAYQELRAKLKTELTREEEDIVRKQMYELQNKKLDRSPRAAAVRDKREEIYREMVAWQYQYFKENPSLVSYYLLYKDVKELRQYPERYRPIMKDISDAQKALSKKYYDHPYRQPVNEMIYSFNRIQEGQPYRDFTAPDLQEQMHQLSDLKQDKIILLDLWGSWCRPCIQKSREMIPIYKQYNSEDFTVISVAREFKNTRAMERIIERESFPWFNMIDLDDQQNVWLTYNLNLGGGGIFLIDEDGKILAIDPTSEKITEILEEKGIAKN